MTVCIFTYYWPPGGGIAVQRMLKLSKFLPEFGWQPIVVTVKNGSYPYYDESLQAEISPSLKVYRTGSFEPFTFYNFLQGKKGTNTPIVLAGAKETKTPFQRITEYIRANFFIPDARKGWVPYALKQADKIFEQNRPDVIVTTGPPHSSHLIGLALKKKYGVKWVADFRDPWTKNLLYEHMPRTALTIRKDEELEEAVLKNADAIVAVGEGLKKEFAGRNNNVEVVYNGFDEDDFKVAPIEDKEQFTLRHVGNLLLTQNAPVLWQAIKELRQENEAFSKKFVFEIVGGVHPFVQSMLNEYGLNECIRMTGFVTHDKAIAYMKGASCLLFLVANVPHSEMLISGKIFEYLATRKPILALSPAVGDASKLLDICNRNKIISFEDKGKMKEQLLECFNQWMAQKGSIEHEGNEHYAFSRKAQCEKFAGILNQLATK